MIAEALYALPTSPLAKWSLMPSGLVVQIKTGKTDTDATQDIQAISRSIRVPFRNLFSKLNAAEDIPPVTCIVSDGAMSFTLQIAEEIGVPEVLLWMIRTCSFLAYMHYPHLIERLYTSKRCELPIKWVLGHSFGLDPKNESNDTSPTLGVCMELANSDQSFLSFIRPDLVAGDSTILPFEFMSQTKNRGMLASWGPQEQVLSHQSIGGFLTHSGWNSTPETICGGVPVICWPFFADQHTNYKYSCTHWGIGTETNNNVMRDEVEKLVRELIEDDKGKEMKSNVMMWKKKAEEATTSVGSSFLNFDNMVNQILLSNGSHLNRFDGDVFSRLWDK
ncbi:hypothetical protein NE237_019127 [Protea cynaroides]|uniref:UDP-glycosyltransferase n=1 Tax=Protea cynaroides TaxID=273540 RepID=A0A9Q0KB54_9MAGN|nr:hypothetical protein NE237_019127 [Protea cynaroides]